MREIFSSRSGTSPCLPSTSSVSSCNFAWLYSALMLAIVRLLRHRFAFQTRAQAFLVSFSGLDLKVGVHRLLFHLRIRKLDNYCVGTNLDARLDRIFSLVLRTAPAPSGPLGNQRANAAHFAQHLASLDCVDDRGGAIECGRSRLESGQSEGDSADGRQTDDNQDHAANALLEFGFSGALYINHESLLLA